MRASLIALATNMFRDVLPEKTQPYAPSRLFAYVEAVAACGLLVLVGVKLFGS